MSDRTVRLHRGPLEMCYLGWQESLVQLVDGVEPVIPD
jgi:hypothetical protein